MLNLVVKRGTSANGGTEGEIYVNDEKFGFTIEDVNRYLEQYLVEGSNDYTELLKHKIPGKTCIPAGEYEIKMRVYDVNGVYAASDTFSFLVNSIPSPSALALLGLGTAVAARRRRF